jgi:hypothetical protein
MRDVLNRRNLTIYVKRKTYSVYNYDYYIDGQRGMNEVGIMGYSGFTIGFEGT